MLSEALSLTAPLETRSAVALCAASGKHQGKIGELCLKHKAAAVALYVTAV